MENPYLLKKRRSRAFNRTCYLLGEDKDGILYWLESANWDCGWYWGGGYVETYTDNIHPNLSADVSSHQHFDSMFFNQQNKNGVDAFKEFFSKTPFTDEEIWKILELMRSFYIARAYSDMLHRGGAHYTENPAKETIKNDREYERINKVVIPKIMQELYGILGGENQ